MGYKLFSVFPYQVKPGTTITLTGNGFTADSKLNINDSVSVPLTNVSEGSAKAVIPASLSYGTYSLSVSNASNSTKNQGFAIKLVVSANPAIAPEVTKVSPDTISSLDSQVTVTGNGFTGNNTIYSAFGSISNISSSGTTLSFTPSQFSDVAKLRSVLSGKESKYLLRIDFYVVNENGMTQKTASFNVQ